MNAAVFLLQDSHKPSLCKRCQKHTEIHIALAAEAVEAGQEQLNRPRVSVSPLLIRASIHQKVSICHCHPFVNIFICVDVYSDDMFYSDRHFKVLLRSRICLYPHTQQSNLCRQNRTLSCCVCWSHTLLLFLESLSEPILLVCSVCLAWPCAVLRTILLPPALLLLHRHLW